MEVGRTSSPWPGHGVAPLPPLPLEASACLFGLAALLAARAWLIMGRPGPAAASPVNKGMQMKRILVALLLVANLARCASLLAELAAQDEALPFLRRWTPDQLRWLRDLITLLPAVVFLSAFSVVVLFWAQLHYTTTIVPLPLLDCLFVCANIACYMLVAAIAVCTFLLQAYTHLRTYLTCIIGVLNGIVAATFAYYGFMVVAELADTARKKLPGRRLTVRVAALSVVCPVLFLLRGAVYLAWGLAVSRPTWPMELALYLLAEWLPSVIALAVVYPLHSGTRASADAAADDSTDSEVPLLQDDAATLQRPPAPGMTWKQLYPQPEQASKGREPTPPV